MAWSLQGEWIESCSCAQVCPCNFGPEGKPDQEWCSAAIGLNITQGNSDGVDLSNARAVFVGDFPGNFNLGNGAMRVYLDQALSADQRRELEAILTGKKGGAIAALADAVSNSLPVKTARISLVTGENPSISVDGAGEVKLQPIKDQNGSSSQLVNSPVGTAFGMAAMDLAMTSGRWNDPDMRSWEAGGAGGVAPFKWSA